MINLENTPNELLRTEHFQEDVSILIGENGSGKSTLLNTLSTHYLWSGQKVIAIANSIHDKFEIRHRNFKALRGRSGRRQSRSTIKSALINISQTDIQRLKRASQALHYVGFKPVIGFKIENLNLNFAKVIDYSDDINDKEKEQLGYLLDKTLRESRFDEIVWLEMERFSFNEIEKSSLLELFKYEALLRRIKVISRIEVFLQKGNNTISMFKASSGELALITSIIYLSTTIDENTVILIDEPENSLHPKWQKEYVKILFDIFYLYQPKVIIATHSPLIVNGAELFIKDPQIFKSQGFRFEPQKKEPLNMEELMFRFFDISTPKNRFLSDILLRYINLLAHKKISLDVFNKEIIKIENKSYDPKQLEVIKAIREIGKEVSNEISL